MASQQNYLDNTTEFLLNNWKSKFVFLNRERLNCEEERMKSFMTWPVHFPVDPCRLAKAGFYYTGDEDEVVCFSCQGHVKNWNYGDIVLKKHADLYPNCDFIKNTSNNIPLLKTFAKSVSNSCLQSNSIDFSKMKSESERLKTYGGKWPLPFINPSTLAHAGFFFTGVDCRVQCPYCKGILSNFDVDTIPFQEHLKQFPWCDFLSENISQAKHRSTCLPSMPEDVCGNTVKKTSTSDSRSICNQPKNDCLQNMNLEDLSVHVYKSPYHPHETSLTTRLSSFASWPSNIPVSKESLAAAGFFYTGLSDRTICFHCNGGLCFWEEGDDPWVEHARWFPTCEFLHLEKGSDFIKSCSIKNTSRKLKAMYISQSDEFCDKEPLLKKVDEAMKSNLVKSTLETDLFPPYIIRAALLLHIKQTGNIFENIDDLCAAASHLKKKMEKQSFDLKPAQTEDFSNNKTQYETNAIAELPGVKYNTSEISPNSSSSPDNKDNLINGLTEKPKTQDECELNEQCLCKICMDKEVGIVFLPCGHLPACIVCAPALKDCPMCRKSVEATIIAMKILRKVPKTASNSEH